MAASEARLTAAPREHAACGVGIVAARDGRPRYDHLDRALCALAAVEHRGAVAVDGRTSDGAGVMAEIPWALIGHAPQSVAVATLFISRADPGAPRPARAAVLEVLERTFAVFELELLELRSVPTHPRVLGRIAAASCPEIVQAIVSRPKACRTEASFEARLYHAKQRTRTGWRELLGPGAPEPAFFTSLSCRTVVYKALTRAADLPAFYPDLLNPRFETRFALFHRRFSTNTRSSWDKAQPFRVLAHNGEINTIAGNRSWSYSREQALGLSRDELLTHRDVSDSGNLNEHVEALRVRSSIPQLEDVLAITVPVAGVRNEFYSFWGRAMEPWDGPALIAWADGRTVGARLDRNGFRPARWALTSELFVLGSEAGIFGLKPAQIEHQGSIAAGSGVTVALDSGEVFFRDPSVSRENLGAGFDARLEDLPPEPAQSHETAQSPAPAQTGDQAADDDAEGGDPLPPPALFRLTSEERDRVILPMARTGKEAIGSMGDTARPSIFSALPRSFFDFFFQGFAQVTNPPLDYLRERSVTDLSTYLGKRPNIFAAKELLPQAPGLRLGSPILPPRRLGEVRAWAERVAGGGARRERPAAGRGVREVDICVDAEALASEGGVALAAALTRIEDETLAAAADGRPVVLLSDRGASLERPPIPSLLALRAAVVALNREGLRLETSLLLESGDLRTTHHVACAVGFGATAVVPYLACALAAAQEGPEGEARLLEALEQGLLKVMSKMGISVLRSYQSAKLFTSLGLGQDLLDRYFPGLESPLGGMGLDQLASDILRGRDAAREAEDAPLESHHLFKEHPRGRGGEAHAMTAARARLVHELTRKIERPAPEQGEAGAGDHAEVAAEGEPEDGARTAWRVFAEAGELAAPVSVRQLLELRSVGSPLALDDVEELRAITARFASGAMSFGAISAEAQRDIFLAMRTVGGRSNSGEGGENPWYFVDGTCASTKQVASGRFGVTAEYLVTGDEIEIKIAQGAKPGEGGQLPGAKVGAEIARARHAGEGVDLISPPPQHDIYSIEDLKQLIFELRTVNPAARIGVKLVSGAEIGTIAVGVAKAGADVIQVSGGDGGTGAAPLSSMKHAGLPWELGLAEVHRALSAHGLRDRVILRVDGGLHTGFDVLVAAALGAEAFGFGKLLLVAQGCIMARICEKNRCPRGIATHDPRFKEKYVGTPEAIVEVIDQLAQEVREGLAELGLPSIEALVGRADALRPARRHLELMSARGIDLSRLLLGASVPEVARVREVMSPWDDPGRALDRAVAAAVLPALDRGEAVSARFEVRPLDRAVLAGVAGDLARRAHARRMSSLIERPRGPEDPDREDYLPPAGSARLRFEGSAGQGFACFLVRGLNVELVGEANDSLAKGMCGGEVAVRAPDDAGFVGEDNVLAGNCALYGATGGALYLRGRAGDRFAVRNSGAEAVVEGVGLHACEYMTGGQVAILGAIGDNAGAGMTGGVLYLHRSQLPRVNAQYVAPSELDAGSLERLRAMVERHHERTGSRSAAAMLEDWSRAARDFVAVRPRAAGAAAQPREQSPSRAS